MAKYILKRLGLLVVTFFIIVTICFMLVRLLPQVIPDDPILADQILAKWEALGYNEPLLVQYGIYLKNIFTSFDFGVSWHIQRLEPAFDLFLGRLAPTMLLSVYSLALSIPLGIILGIFAAIKKNKWPDHVVSTSVVLFISIPSYVTAFLIQYFLCFKFGWFPLTVSSLVDAGGSWFSPTMIISMMPAVIALTLGTIAGLARTTRAELTETLTTDYMLLARTKGLTHGQATRRHALKNAMIPILPGIIGGFFSIVSGSFIIEQIFSVPGVAQIYLQSINTFDYDVFIVVTMFYTLMGLLAGIVVDVSYGFVDPRIRVGER